MGKGDFGQLTVYRENEAAFNEFWKDFMPDKGYEVPTVSEAAQENREASGKLEQDSHDGQTPEREDERGNGDAEH